MSRLITALLLASICALTAAADTSRHTFTISYLSAENVYLDGGRADGLAVGDTLNIVKNDSSIVLLMVAFVSEHSASCKASVSVQGLRSGDKAEIVKRATTPRVPADSAKIPVMRDTSTAVSALKPLGRIRPKPQLYGNISLVLFHWNDRSAADLNFTQTTLRLDLKGTRLWGKPITLAIQSRGRYDQRQRILSPAVNKDKWENRIWEFSIAYGDPNMPINLYAGRILPRYTAGVGYLDGLMFDSRVSDRVHAGFFSGTQPELLYNGPRLSLTKGGVFVNYRSGSYGGTYFQQNIAALGEYHASEISRELISFQGYWGNSQRWSLSHTGELDINRSWRKDKVGKSASLSYFYLGGNYSLTPRLNLGLSYDYRQNYWTYNTRTLPDSLFDSRIDRGAGAQLRLLMPNGSYTSAGVNLRKHAGDARQTFTYFAGVTKSGFGRATTMISLYWSGFSGLSDKGQNYSIRVGQNFIRFGMVGLGYGIYSYGVVGISGRRTNRWAEVSGELDVISRCFFNVMVQYNSGDDIKGTRFQTELGCHF